MMQTIERFLKKVALLCHSISAYLVIPGIAVLVGADVHLRYIFSTPLPWQQEVSSLLLFIGFVLAFSSSWLKGVHVRMEMFYSLASYRLKRCSDVLTAVCGLVVFGMLGWQAFRDIPYMRAVSERSTELGIHLWTFRLLLAMLSALLCLQLLLFLGRSMWALLIGERSHGKL